VLLAATLRASEHFKAEATVLVAVGAAGEDDFGKVFKDSALAWQKAAEAARAKFIAVGLTNAAATNDLQEFQAALDSEIKDGPAELWIVLLGHGTWDNKEAKFNLRGPDLSAMNLAQLLQPFTRPIAVINTASASAPFMKALTHTNRVVITATKSGAEQNYARLGRYLSESIADPAADLDKDGQTSLLESFLMASRSVAEFYKSEGRLATEHALLDDNGDGLGTPAEWFRGIRVVKAPAQGGAVDGLRAHQWHLVRSSDDQKLTPEQRHRRDELEREVAALRREKPLLKEDVYYERLEALLSRMAEVVLSDEPAGDTRELPRLK
jgi:hypothetical protein